MADTALQNDNSLLSTAVQTIFTPLRLWLFGPSGSENAAVQLVVDAPTADPLNIATGHLTSAQLSAIEKSTRGTQPISADEVATRTGLIQNVNAGGTPAESVFPKFDLSGFKLPSVDDILPDVDPDTANIVLWAAVLVTVLLIISLVKD